MRPVVICNIFSSLGNISIIVFAKVSQSLLPLGKSRCNFSIILFPECRIWTVSDALLMIRIEQNLLWFDFPRSVVRPSHFQGQVFLAPILLPSRYHPSRHKYTSFRSRQPFLSWNKTLLKSQHLLSSLYKFYFFLCFERVRLPTSFRGNFVQWLELLVRCAL